MLRRIIVMVCVISLAVIMCVLPVQAAEEQQISPYGYHELSLLNVSEYFLTYGTDNIDVWRAPSSVPLISAGSNSDPLTYGEIYWDVSLSMPVEGIYFTVFCDDTETFPFNDLCIYLLDSSGNELGVSQYEFIWVHDYVVDSYHYYTFYLDTSYFMVSSVSVYFGQILYDLYVLGVMSMFSTYNSDVVLSSGDSEFYKYGLLDYDPGTMSSSGVGYTQIGSFTMFPSYMQYLEENIAVDTPAYSYALGTFDFPYGLSFQNGFMDEAHFIFYTIGDSPQFTVQLFGSDGVGDTVVSVPAYEVRSGGYVMGSSWVVGSTTHSYSFYDVVVNLSGYDLTGLTITVSCQLQAIPMTTMLDTESYFQSNGFAMGCVFAYMSPSYMGVDEDVKWVNYFNDKFQAIIDALGPLSNPNVSLDEGMLDDMQQAGEELGAITDKMEQMTPQVNAGDVNVDIGDMVDPDHLSTVTNVLASVTTQPIVASILVTVFSMALVGFIFFGKR